MALIVSFTFCEKLYQEFIIILFHILNTTSIISVLSCNITKIFTISLDCTDDAMLEVREHIEKVVETLVGDDLDETSVIRLVNHPSCKYFSSMYSYFLII